MINSWHLFLAFFRVGLFGFGGGPSMIPLVEKEVVERYQWMSKTEFGDVLAIGNTLPGPIATKMAGYIGYKVDRLPGCLIAVIATTIPAIVAMVLLLTVLSAYKDLDWVNGISRGVIPVVAVMMATLTWDFMSKALKTLGYSVALAMTAVSGLLIVWFDLHPGVLIGALLLVALCWPEPHRRSSGKSSEDSSEPVGKA